MIETIYHVLEKLGFGEPIHPPMDHMPEGLVVGAWVLLLASWLLRRPTLEVSARHCMVLSLIFLFPAVVSGYMDWQHFYSGAWIFAIKIKIALSVLFLVVLAASVIISFKAEGRYAIILTAYTLCFINVLGIGFYGGQLVYGKKAPVSQAELQAGEKIFEANCRSCHPQGGNIINPKLPLNNSPQLADFNVFIAYNRNPKRPDGSKGIMPPYPPDKISDQQMRDLYNYMKASFGNKP
jgi:mono/diheme cytochrome c family protein